MRLFRKLLFIVFFAFNSLFNGFSQWMDISPQARKERIYSIDVPLKDTKVNIAKYPSVFDTIVAVGWSSTSGAFMLTFDGGKNWNIMPTASLFPFSVNFLGRQSFVVCGYNYVFDDAEVRIFDLSGREISRFEFDGEDLPYTKNFFDCLVIDSNIFVPGYSGSIYKYSLSEQIWKEIFVDSNIVFLKIKHFDLDLNQNGVSIAFLLGGKSFQFPTRLYFSNQDLTQWSLLYDFQAEYSGIEIADFWFYGWDFENSFPEGFIVATIDDTIAIFRSNPQERTFEIVFSQQNIEQPIGIYSFDSTKYFVVLLSNGEFIFSSDFGNTWQFEYFGAVPKSITGAKFFYFRSEDLLPEILWERLEIIAFGLDGTILKYNRDFSLSVDVRRYAVDKPYDEIEIYDLLGRLIFKAKTAQFDFKECGKNLHKGIFLVVKKANGILCDTVICIVK